MKNKKIQILFFLLPLIYSVPRKAFAQANITINQAGPVNVNNNDNFYDAGGAAGVDGNTNYTITLVPAVAGESVCLDFTMFNTYYDYSALSYAFGDSVCIFDGSNTASNKIATLMGNYGAAWNNGTVPTPVGIGTGSGFAAVTTPGIFCSTNPLGSLTISFYNIDPTTSPGWAAKIKTYKTLGNPGCNIALTATPATICNGSSTTLTATGNVVAAAINNNFNSGSVGTGWAGTGAVTFQNNASNACLKPSLDGTTYIWMANQTCPRTLTSNSMNVSNGGTISFEYRQADFNSNASPCESPDINMSGSTPESVFLQYSLNGTTWTTLKVMFPINIQSPAMTGDNYSGCGYEVRKWNKVVVPIPTAAATASTQFRWIMPLCTSASTDNWGLDNVVIASPNTSTITITELTGGTVVGVPSATSPYSISVSPTVTTTYRATITDGTNTCFNDVTVTVNPCGCVPPSITTQPAPIAICANGNTSFTVAATGGNGSFQWQVNTGSGWTNITNNAVYSGATSATLGITGATAAMNSYQYQCIVYETVGTCPSTSTAVTLTVNALPTVTSVSSGNISCTTANATLTGTSAGNTMVWNGGALTNAANPATVSAAGTYTVTATSGAGCTNTTTLNVTSNTTLPTVTSVSSGNISCTAVNATLTGTSVGNTMVWNGGALTNAANPATVSAAGTYTVTATNTTNGCTNTSTVNVTSNTTLPSVTSASSGNISCTTANATLTGTSVGNTMVWNGGALTNATNPATVSAAGTYTVTATNATNGCTNTSTVNVTSNTTLPTVTSVSSGNISCTAANATLTGTSAGNTMVWNGGTLTNAANPATVGAAGTYTVTATNTTNGCTNTSTVNVTSNTTAPTVTTSGSGIINCSSGSTTLTGISAGNTMVWNGGALVNAANPASATAAGTYTVTATNPTNGCIGTATMSVTATSPNVSAGPNLALSCTTTSGSINVTSTTPGVTYLWSPAVVSGGTTNTATVNAAGTYTCVVSDASSSCSNSAVINVTSSTTPPAVTSVSSGNITCTTTSVTLTGTSAGNTMVWNGGTLTNATNPATVGAAGTYTVTATNAANGCTNTSTVNITSNTTPPAVTSVSSGNITCSSPNATLTGTSPGNTMVWNGGTLTNAANPATVTTAGTYTVTATNPSNGCTNTSSVIVTSTGAFPNISIATPLQITCTSSSVTLTGGSTTSNIGYQWTTGPATATYTVSAAGTYTLTVTNLGTGCASQQTVNVTTNTTPPTVTSSSSGNITCVNASAILTGTSAGNTMVWSGGVLTNATNPATVSAAGTYTVTATNTINGCTNTSQIIVTSNTTLPTVSSVSSGNISCTNANATLTGTSVGNNMVWNGGTLVNATNPASVTTAGTYTVTATNPTNGCTNTSTVTITSNTTAPNVTAGPSAIISCITGTTSISANSTTTGATYNWSGPGITAGGATSSPTVNTVGTYTVTVTNPVNGCTITSTVAVGANAPPIASAGNDITITSGTSTTLTATGGATYLWNTGETTNPIIVSPAITTDYCVTATDVLGCSDTACVTVAVDIQCGELFVPTAFSPNGDGVNDVFRIKVNPLCVLQMQLLVFDRWGEKIIEITDPNLFWDGTYKGKALDNAVFVYYLTMTLSNSPEPIKKTGNVSLLK